MITASSKLPSLEVVRGLNVRVYLVRWALIPMDGEPSTTFYPYSLMDKAGGFYPSDTGSIPVRGFGSCLHEYQKGSGQEPLQTGMRTAIKTLNARFGRVAKR